MKLNEIYGDGSSDEVPGEKHYGMYYNSLNDAQKYNEAYSPGNTYEIWFMKPEYFRDFIMGLGFLKKHKKELIPLQVKDLSKTHIKLGSISGQGTQGIEDVFHLMQGEIWSREGEARKLIKGLGLAHTSMSVGDMVVTSNGRLWFTDNVGFVELHPIDAYQE